MKKKGKGYERRGNGKARYCKWVAPSIGSTTVLRISCSPFTQRLRHLLGLYHAPFWYCDRSIGFERGRVGKHTVRQGEGKKKQKKTRGNRKEREMSCTMDVILFRRCNKHCYNTVQFRNTTPSIGWPHADHPPGFKEGRATLHSWLNFHRRADAPKSWSPTMNSQLASRWRNPNPSVGQHKV